MYKQVYKYYNTQKVTNELGRWDSKFEAAYARKLELRKKAGDILSWEPHVKLELIVNDFVVCTYEIDFIVHHDGETEYVECKGYPTQVWRLKWKLFEALYDRPGNKLTVVFQGKNKPPKARRKKHIRGIN